jgi:translation elongation factor EF-Ts
MCSAYTSLPKKSFRRDVAALQILNCEWDFARKSIFKSAATLIAEKASFKSHASTLKIGSKVTQGTNNPINPR